MVILCVTQESTALASTDSLGWQTFSQYEVLLTLVNILRIIHVCFAGSTRSACSCIFLQERPDRTIIMGLAGYQWQHPWKRSEIIQLDDQNRNKSRSIAYNHCLQQPISFPIWSHTSHTRTPYLDSLGSRFRKRWCRWSEAWSLSKCDWTLELLWQQLGEDGGHRGWASAFGKICWWTVTHLWYRDLSKIQPVVVGGLACWVSECLFLGMINEFSGLFFEVRTARYNQIHGERLDG